MRRGSWAVLAAISAGGALGAAARYGLSVAWPHRPGTFPWATFVTNVSGCLLIGVLMVLVTQVWAAHRLLRPFSGRACSAATPRSPRTQWTHSG